MPFEIQADATLQILRARYNGEMTQAARAQHARAVLAAARHTGLHRWLLDFREAHARSADRAQLERMADELVPQLSPDVRMAYLLRYDHQLDDTFEQLVRARGVDVERFHDAAFAITWLRAPVPSAQAAAAGPAGDGARAAGVDRTLERVAAVVGRGVHVSPEASVALGELVQDLLGTGMDEARVREIVGRTFSALNG